MSNLSDIGFPAKTGKEFGQLIELAATKGERIPCGNGAYLKYTDPSGAELYCQINKKNEILGMNPHFNGISRLPVAITSKVERSESALDGSFHGWAAPTDKSNPESGSYPFVFDLPDFYTLPSFTFPYYTSIQLTAFAQSEFDVFLTESEFEESQKEGIKFSAQSFIPIGLFSGSKEEGSPSSPEAYAIINARLVKWEKRINTISGQEFIWILAETLGGQVDVVADPKLIRKELKQGSIISGQFWLSGKIT